MLKDFFFCICICKEQLNITKYEGWPRIPASISLFDGLASEINGLRIWEAARDKLKVRSGQRCRSLLISCLQSLSLAKETATSVTLLFQRTSVFSPMLLKIMPLCWCGQSPQPWLAFAYKTDPNTNSFWDHWSLFPSLINLVIPFILCTIILYCYLIIANRFLYGQCKVRQRVGF